MQSSKYRQRIFTCLKISVSTGLLFYLMWLIDWGRAAKAIQQADKLLFVVAPCSLLVGFIASSCRWISILKDYVITFTFQKAYKGYLIGAFYNIFLPGAIGGDAVRIPFCMKESRCSLANATASVMLERISGGFALFFFVLCVCLLAPASLSPVVAVGNTRSVIVMATAAVMAIAAMMLGLRVLSRWSPERPAKGLWKIVVQGIQPLVNLRRRTLGKVLILSAVYQAIDIVAAFLLSRAIGLTLSPVVFFAVIPLVYLATVLPISVGGLGVREGTLVVLLTQFGVASSDAVTLSFLIYLNRLGIGTLGGVIQLVETLKIRVTQQGSGA